MSDKYIDVIIADRPTRDKILGAATTGGLGYTDADGTVHKIDSDYIEGGGGGGGGTFIINVLYSDQYMQGYLDKNFTEIRTALASGIVPLVVDANPEAPEGTAYYYDYVLYTEIYEGTYKVDIGVNSSISYVADSATGVLHVGA